MMVSELLLAVMVFASAGSGNTTPLPPRQKEFKTDQTKYAALAYEIVRVLKGEEAVGCFLLSSEMDKNKYEADQRACTLALINPYCTVFFTSMNSKKELQLIGLDLSVPVRIGLFRIRTPGTSDEWISTLRIVPADPGQKAVIVSEKTWTDPIQEGGDVTFQKTSKSLALTVRNNDKWEEEAIAFSDFNEACVKWANQ